MRTTYRLFWRGAVVCLLSALALRQASAADEGEIVANQNRTAAGKIENGVLAPGARMPSVRIVSERHGISTSTALQAYRLLQDRGILIARRHRGEFPGRDARRPARWRICAVGRAA